MPLILQGCGNVHPGEFLCVSPCTSGVNHPTIKCLASLQSHVSPCVGSPGVHAGKTTLSPRSVLATNTITPPLTLFLCDARLQGAPASLTHLPSSPCCASPC
jgi:hypothetical protein